MASSKHPNVKGVVLTAAESVFYDAMYDAEAAWQVAIKVAVTQAQVTAADITKHRAIVTAAVAANSTTLGGPSRQALHDLTGLWS